MLNGRSECDQTFTSMLVHRALVVDSCTISYENLCNFTDIAVHLTADIVISIGNIANIAPVSIPDHSLLSWNIVTRSEKLKVPLFKNYETSYAC